MSETQTLPPPIQMMRMITGFWTSCCIYNVAKLDIADLLHDKAMTADQLAEITHAHAPSLYRVLRALASTGVFSENEKGEFSNTPLSETLRNDVPGSMKAMAIAQLGDHFPAWGNLMYSIKTGNIAFDKVEGMPIWEFYSTHPAEGLNFVKAMAGATGSAIANVLPAYDFSKFKTIIDVGGGNGAMLMAILKSAPNTTGIVFDEEYVVQETAKEIKAKGMTERCSTSGGDFFESIPSGADAYIMKFILHDWNDEKSQLILKNCSAAMNAGSKLLVIEGVIPEGNVPHPSKFMDINMMAMTGGKERTEKEYTALFEKADLKLSKIIPTNAPNFSVIEVIKV